jgi:hypothetical protein
MDPTDPGDLRKLRDAIRENTEVLDPFRVVRKDRLKELVGNHYRGDNSVRATPMPLMAYAVYIYSYQLAAEEPQVVLVGKEDDPDRESDLLTFELAMNQRLKRLKWATENRTLVMDAIMLLGVLKTGLASAGTMMIEGEEFEVMKTYSSTVDFDDYFFDTRARKPAERRFCGDRYRVGLEWAQANPSFDEIARAVLTPMETHIGQSPSRDSHDLAEGAARHEDSYGDLTEICDVWLRDEGLLVTLDPEGGAPALNIIEYEDPEGPYLELSFQEVPANMMPLAPTAMWTDAHELANDMMNKAAKQARRQKTVGAYQGATAEDAKRITETADGVTVHVNQGGEIKELKYGGADERTVALSLQAKQLFNTFAGNPEVLGGAGPASETVGQEEIISGAASKRIDYMNQRVEEVARAAILKMARYEWGDPLVNMSLRKMVPGTEVAIPTTFTSEATQGEFPEDMIDIIPYSMRYFSPIERMRMIERDLNSLGPWAQMMEAQGAFIDFKGLQEMKAHFYNMPEFRRYIKFRGAEPAPQGQDHGQRKAMVTHRTTERVNRSSQTARGQDNANIAALLRGGVQDGEAARAVNAG